jgi:wobble nucleotide-excising tRNase
VISKINRLSNFGTYRQFQWGVNAPFTKRNLIYGWNYSGKTTLSRLIQILEEPALLTNWQGCQFDIELQSGTRLTNTNLANPPRIKVFNRDFINRNFQQEHQAPAVFIVGGNTIHLRNRISRLNEHQTKIQTTSRRYSENQRRLQSELDQLGTDHARATATLTADRNYNRTKLLEDVGSVRTNPINFIVREEDLQAKVSLLRSTENWAAINSVNTLVSNLDTLRQDLDVVLQKTASNEAIAKLKENRDLESWIRTGLVHHSESTQCEFCGSPIPQERWLALQKHFSQAYEALTLEVTAQITRLEGIGLRFTLPDERDFTPDLRLRFVALMARIQEWTTWAETVISELSQLAKQKQLLLESPLQCNVDTNRASEVVGLVQEINAIITDHNQKRSQLDIEKRTAKNAIEKHQAASFYQDSNIAGKETAIQAARDKVNKSQSLLRVIESEIRAMESQIQQQSIGAQKIDETVQFLLPDNNISVVEISGGSFEFRRDGAPAKNLSEGEKTAITFAYFLVTLENNGASLPQTIVFIDDPISSLDSNHIYSIYALITKKLESSLQIFVATHNSELYTLLKDHWFVARHQYANHGDACSYYTRRFIDGTSQMWHSTLEDMPILLRKYKSEYLFVFDQLHHFSSALTPSIHEAYTSPNLLRKLLEAYLGFQKPSVSKWSDKLDLLFNTDVERVEIQKFADDASHLQGLSRALQEPNFIANSQNTVRKVITALKAKDLPHYTSLCTVIGVTP